jgi:HK97 family phage portal protein
MRRHWESEQGGEPLMAVRLPIPFRSREAAKINRADRLTDVSVGYSTVPARYNDFKSYLESYKSVPWVRPCVSVIAYNAANVTLRLLRPNVEGDDEEITASPLLDLLARPNPRQTQFDLIEKTIMHLELTGNAYWSLEERDARGIPSEIYVLRPDRVTVLPDRETGIAGYRYTVNGRKVEYEPGEIVHLSYPNPIDDLYGMGVIEAAEQRSDSARALVEHEARFWRSGAKITGVVKTPEKMDTPSWDRFIARIKQWLSGGQSGYSMMVLEDGMEYQSVSDGPAKLGMLEMARMSRDEILAMFGVPPTKVGILENANYKAAASDQFFWTETVDPKLTRVEQALQPLVELFHPGEDLHFAFERLNFEDDLAQANVVSALAHSGTQTLNELRQYQGKDPIEGGDVVFIPGNLMPFGPGFSPEQSQQGQREMQRQLAIATALDNAGQTAEADQVRARAEAELLPDAQSASPEPAKSRASVTRPASAHLFGRRRDRYLRRAEADYGPALARAFAEQRDAVLAKLRRRKSTKALTLRDIWDNGFEQDRLKAVLGPLYDEALKLGYEEAVKAFGLDTSFDLDNPRISSYRGRLADRIVGISDTTRDAVAAQIVRGSRAGYSPKQIADGVPEDGYAGVSGVFDQAAGYRASMIVRTESMHAYAGAAILSYRESGAVEECEILDGDYDEVCAERDGKVIPLDEAEDYLQAEHPNGTMAIIPVIA